MLTSRRSRRDFLLGALLGSASALLARRAAAAERALEPRLGAGANVLDVRSCGATGNGHDLDTAAINDAIATVSRGGGGVVRVSAGDYLCNTIHLQNGVTLQLDRGAILRAAAQGHYDIVEPNRWARYQDFGHDHWRNSMICGLGVENAAIVGPGLLCGDGLSRGRWSEGLVQSRGVADKVIALKQCRNITLSGFNLVGSAHFGVLATGVEKLAISGLLVDTGRDGIDIDCSAQVAIEDVCFNTPYDDSIALKSSAALGYQRPTSDVRISRCLVTGGFEPGTLYDGRRVPVGARDGMKGRIKIGTESCWGFENIVVENCAIWNALGIPLLTVDGGALKNVVLRDIVMENIQDSPLFLRLGERLRAFSDAAVHDFRGVTVENLKCSGFGMPIMIAGIPGHRIENVTLRNIELVERSKETVPQSGGWMAVGEAAARSADLVPPEATRSYPEVGMFGPLPAKLLFARHVAGLAIDGLHLSKVTSDRELSRVVADRRPLFWFEDLVDERLAGVAVPGGKGEAICRSDRPVSFPVVASHALASPPDWLSGNDLLLKRAPLAAARGRTVSN
ncbi:MAG TPA: glycosyl hydrolase family 28 protein [Stellaceae bacterium]|jgi:hypothetical protein